MNSSDPISVIARSLGSDSESAAPPSRGQSVARHGNMAVTEVLIRLQIARGKLPASIDSNLSAVDLRSGRIVFVARS